MEQKMFTRTYDLPLSRNYVRHWGIIEAVRELIQNALDSDSPFLYEIDKEDDGSFTLLLRSEHATLPVSSLLLGSTTKAEATDKIGSFGEGYKIALLVLTREQCPVAIWNGDVHWRPFFQFSRKFDDELLTIEETAMPHKNRGLSFLVSGLSGDLIEDIRASCLHMQDHIGAIRQTPKGDILLEQKGRLYVGGLFICETEMDFGYNVKPEYITLERDRKTVDGWDLKCLTRDMWYATGDMERVTQLIDEEVPDLEYAKYSAPEIVRDACYRVFIEKNGSGALNAKSAEELKAMVKAGMTTVVQGGWLGSVASESSLYSQRRLVPVTTPADVLAAWWAHAKYHIHASCKAEFEDILKQSKTWSKK